MEEQPGAGRVATACLSDAQIAELRAVAPGEAREEVARHLASCSRCQQRLLFGEARRPGARRAAPELPTMRRALLLAALVLAAMLAFFWTLYQLAGRIE